MEMSMRSAIRVETGATGAFIPMTMWRECRGRTIRHRSQSRTLVTSAAELMETAIRKWWISSLRAAIVEEISIAHATIISRRLNR
jgi:hypothetical protein